MGCKSGKIDDFGLNDSDDTGDVVGDAASSWSFANDGLLDRHHHLEVLRVIFKEWIQSLDRQTRRRIDAVRNRSR